MAKIFEITANQFVNLAKEQPLQLIDIREPNEYASENIASALSMPLSQLDINQLNALAQEKTLVFHCLSGMRTFNNASRFAEVNAAEIFILTVGLNGWKRSGLVTVVNP